MTRLGDLRDCGRRPNCISSNATNAKRRIGPWRLTAEPQLVWRMARHLVAATERTRIVEEADYYLRAEVRSKLMKFVDDLELALDLETDQLGIRSASRLGYSDRGVNRRRVERLQRQLVERKLIEP